MTEREAIEKLQFFKKKLCNGIFGDRIGVFDVAISAVEEIQQYRALGTVEEFREAREKQKEIEDIVNMQLITEKDNYKEVYNSFYDIVKVVLR